ncbi:hypothetical protein [Sinorhizobium meliloti]|uniref:hypothetical protein n=1 Tax=Rhizobium meliloti TaxID=382 RepID=UPI00299ED570|nr:hypothetical protein [Sinorhizobium meliloti]
MRHLVGLDINGWHDWAARNWSASEDHPIDYEVADGGIASVVIFEMGAQSEQPIGGPQAHLAPHGRGIGWGPIGNPDRRARVRDLLDPNEPFEQKSTSAALLAVVSALSLDAKRIVFAVSDTEAGMNEGRQTALLGLLRHPKQPLPVLLWKPVAVLLQAITEGLFSELDIGRDVDIICHEADGLSLQTLRIASPKGTNRLLAPERHVFGKLVVPELGLLPLQKEIARQWVSTNPDLTGHGIGWHCEAEKWLLDDAERQRDHVLRKANGDWVKVVEPTELQLAYPSVEMLSNTFASLLKGSGPILLQTPLRADLALKLSELLAGASGRQVLLRSADSVALGCLEAAKRIEKGHPHYLDRLEQISVVVMERGEPVFKDLVPKDATVPANKAFISEPIRSLVWPQGSFEQDFYVRKGESEIRKWMVRGFEPPQEDQPVVMQLTQMPAQGWARVEISSSTWSALQQKPIRLDWETMPIEARTADDILGELRTPPPVAPDRTRYPYSEDLWTGVDGQVGLLEELKHFNASRYSVPTNVLAIVTRQYRPIGSSQTYFAVSTDGDLPQIPGAAEALEACIRTVAGWLMDHVKRNRSPSSNDMMRLLSWCFARCPVEIQDEMIKALSEPQHPFLRPTAGRTVLLQGLGRTITDEGRLRQVLDLVSHFEQNMHTRACIAFLLSRKDAAPRALTEESIGRIARIADDSIKGAISARKFQVDFNYSLQLVAGLLRFREVEPFALVCGTSPYAAKLEATLTRAQDAMRPLATRLSAKMRIVEELRAMLAGTGGSRNVLYAIEGASSSDEAPTHHSTHSSAP